MCASEQRPLSPDLPLSSIQRARFLARAGRLPKRELSKGDIQSPQFWIASHGPLAVYWCPTDPPTRMNNHAKVLLVGVTPGLHQARLALQTARDALHTNPALSYADVCRRANRRAAFADLQSQIAAWLDEIRVNDRLCIASCTLLFTDCRSLLALTSAIRYPAFINGANYNGRKGGPITQPFLLPFIETLLADAVHLAPQALVIPLGMKTEIAVQHLVDAGALDSWRMLRGFPHPSGANGKRFILWEAHRASLQGQVNRWFDSDPQRHDRPRVKTH